MAEWNLRDEIAEIIDDAINPMPWVRIDASRTADRIMDLLERSSADEPTAATRSADPQGANQWLSLK